MSAALRRKLKGKKPPEGWELIEEVMEDFEQQMKEAVAEEHLGKRKAELNWKIHRIHWEKNRFIYDLMYVRKVMSKELFDYLVREKFADGALIAKWRKPGYEILCSMLAIQKGGHNFKTTSLCRVPLRQRAPQQRCTPSVETGWNTPVEDETQTADEHRAQWAQPGAEEAPPPPKRKRQGSDEEEELDEEVAARVQALRKGLLG